MARVLGPMALVVTALLVMTPNCDGQAWLDIAALLTDKVSGLWHLNNEVDFMGHTCRYSQAPKIVEFKFYYEGKMWCEGWAPFTGRALKLSPSGAVEHATRDFVRQAFESDLITEKEAQVWLDREKLAACNCTCP